MTSFSGNGTATVYPKKYAHGFCFAVLCCGYTLTDFPISIRLTSLVLWQSNDCPSASKATLMNMDKYFIWIHYERVLNHNKTKHNKTVCVFLGIYCMCLPQCEKSNSEKFEYNRSVFHNFEQLRSVVPEAGTSNYIPQYLWDVITCLCPWYLLLVQHCSIINVKPVYKFWSVLYPV